MRKFLAILVCKLGRAVGKLVGKGSSMPGKFALKICPDILARVQLPSHIIAVTAEDGSYTWEFPEGQSLESITVSISMKEQGGYYDQYLIHQLTRTDERADYASDAVFANFRNVAVGDLGENAFFRSSSPVNNVIR